MVGVVLEEAVLVATLTRMMKMMTKMKTTTTKKCTIAHPKKALLPPPAPACQGSGGEIQYLAAHQLRAADEQS
ncbi:hypothetical protein IWW47_005523 [Coemansia sp. RSA 2052]|nr:hypothetical protein IWW47_005523 [Coemansia sp. RSA 2052]